MINAPADNLRRIKRIGVFGHVGNQNLGDEAIISAVIQNINIRCLKTEIYGFTLNPEDTRKRHQIIAFPIRRIRALEATNKELTANKSIEEPLSRRKIIKGKLKTVRLVYACLRGMKKGRDTFWGTLAELKFLVRCYRNLRGIDLLIIAGSQQLIDYIGGPWAHTYTLFKWILLAKIVRTKVAFVSVGVGPVRSLLGKFFTRKSLVLASYRSYRDETSRAFVQTLGVAGQHSVFPDLVYSLKIDASSTNGGGQQAVPVVGINPVPFSDEQYWPGASASNYKNYIGKLASFALWVIERGYRLLFFPTQLYLDPPVIKDIKNVLEVKANRDLDQNIVDKPICSFDDLVSAICTTDIVVATRFHGIIIPYLLNKPVLGIAYQRKTIDLMAQMGQSDYVVDINSFDVGSLKTRFISLESRSRKIKEEIKRRNVDFRHALHNQYDQVFKLV